MYLLLVPMNVREMPVQVNPNVIRTKNVSVFVLSRYGVQTWLSSWELQNSPIGDKKIGLLGEGSCNIYVFPQKAFL